MAEYAGLEIRIGGNTTKLTNALKAPTKAAAELQREIRQITRAMQFDPTDLKNVDTRIRLTGDRMQSLQSKAQIARKAMEELGETSVKFGDGERKVRDIANETHNLALRAKQADERFNDMTGRLAKVYEAWNNLSRDQGVQELMGTFSNAGLTQAEAERLMKSTTSMRDFKDTVRELQSYTRNNPGYIGTPVSDADIEKLERLKNLNFHGMFEQGVGLDEMVKQAHELGVAIEDSAVENVRELQTAFKDAQKEKDALGKAETFRQMGVDVQRLDSEVESLSQTTRKLDDGITSVTKSNDFQAVETEVRKVDAALDKVNEDLRTTGEAMKADPKNVQLAARYYNDLQQKVSLSEEKAELLKKQMDMLDASGAREAAESHKDLAKWVEDSAEAARVAQKDLSEQRAAVDNLEVEYKSLEQIIATLKGDSTATQFSRDVLEWQRQTKSLSSAMDVLKTRLSSVKDAQTALGKAQTNFDEATKNAEKLKSKLEALKREQKELTEAFERGDPSTDYAKVIQRLNELENEIPQVERAYEGAQQAVEECNRELKAQASAADKAQKALDRQQKEVDELKGSVDKLAKTPDVKLFQNPTGEIENAQKELGKLGQKLDEARGKEERLAKAYDSAHTENELAKSAQKLRDVSQAADGAKVSAKEADDALKNMGGSILNASTVKSIGMTLSATLTPAVTAIGYKMVEASSTVDAAYRDMRKTVGGTEQQFEHLRSAAIDFSRTHVTSADQILQIEAIGGELGIATENLETFAEVISNLDVATNLDVEGAAQALGHLSNILKLTEEDYVGFSDALVRLGNNGASTETEITNIAERIGSMGSIVKMSAPDILAWSSTIASTGQNAEAAGTAISKTMSFMETAVAAAGGTLDTSFEAINAAVQEGGDRLTVFASLAGQTADEFVEAWESDPQSAFGGLKEQLEGAKGDLQMIADVAHMSADEFAQAWKSDPTAALEAFIKGLNDVEAAEGSADSVLQNLGITSVRQKQAIEGLMQSIGGLDDNLKMSRDAWSGVSDEWGKAGDAANEAQKKAEGFSGQIEILKNMWQNFLAELGEGAAPWIQRLSGTISDLTKWFSGLTDGTKEFIVAAGGIAAALGPVLSIGSTIGSAKKNFKDWADEATSAMTLVKTASKLGMKGVTEATTKSMGTLQKFGLTAANVGMSLLKGLAVGAVVAGIAYIVSEMEEARRHTERVNSVLRDMGDDTEGLVPALSNGGRALSDFGKAADVARADIDGLLEKMEGHNRAINDARESAETEIGLLGQYKSVIDECAGAEEVSADQKAKLKWALDGLNEATGSAFTAEQVLKGSFEDEQGAIHNTIEEIDNLIAKRQEAARAKAYEEMYTEAIKAQAEAEQELARAYGQFDYQNRAKWIEDYIKNGGDAANADRAWADNHRELAQTISDAEHISEQADKRVNDFGKAMGRAAEASAEGASAIRAWADGHTYVSNMLGSLNMDFDAFVEAMEKAGVTAEDMDAISKTEFAQMAASCGGSVDTLIKKILDYRNTDPGDKHTTAKGTGNVIDGTATSSIDRYRGASLGPDKRGSVSVDGIDSINTALARIREFQSYGGWIGKVTGKLAITTERIAAGQATGGLNSRPVIPRHATGYIATGPTLTNQGWVGEDGIEAVANWATGGAVVPLTNRKYMLPIADAIADGMVGKLGSMGGDTYVVTLNGATLNDDAHMRQVTYDFLSELRRKAGDNCG